MAFQHIVKALVELWIAGLWYRLRKDRGRAPAYGGGPATLRERFLLDAGLIFAFYCFAHSEMSKSCVAVVAYWAVLCGGWPDALAMLLVFSLAFNKCVVAGICLSVGYTSWVAARSIVSWKNQHSSLPSYAAFRASLRPVKKSKKQGRAGKEEEECIVCWSSDELPLRLPCRRSHMVCAECLGHLQERFQNQCPLCRRRLYAMESGDGEACAFVIACIAASCAIGPVFVALTCYKESFSWATFAALLTGSITAPILLDVWRLLTFPLILDDEDLEDWVVSMVVRHGGFAVAFACWSVCRIWMSDRVTFVDGELVGKLEVWMRHSFFWNL